MFDMFRKKLGEGSHKLWRWHRSFANKCEGRPTLQFIEEQLAAGNKVKAGYTCTSVRGYHDRHVLVLKPKQYKKMAKKKTKAEPRPTVAEVEWIRGDRRMSEFMRAAGLGLSGVGIKERSKLLYKAGESVDEARVLRALERLIQMTNEEKTEFEISCPKVISIYPLPEGQEFNATT